MGQQQPHALVGDLKLKATSTDSEVTTRRDPSWSNPPSREPAALDDVFFFQVGLGCIPGTESRAT